jgi:hypothetical protein
MALVRAIVLAALILPGLSSCWFRKPKVPPPPAKLPPPSQPLPPNTPVIAPPPRIETEAPETPAALESIPDSSAAAPAKKRPPRRRPQPVTAAPKTAPPETPAPAQPAPDPQPPALPKLAQILTAEQQREYTRVLDASLERARRAVAILEKKPLTGDDNDALNRIRTFLKQAEDARSQDLVTAVNLGTRADLLARDLLARIP